MEIKEADTRLTIDRNTLQKYLEEGRPLLVLDVRPAEEWEEWHVPGSIHVDAYAALKRDEPGPLADLDLPSDRPVVTVCGAGKTSLTAARLLRERGTNAFSLEGGMKDWTLAFNTAAVELEGTSADILQVRRTGKGCLSYVIAADEEAAVIDPSLPTEVYLNLAARQGRRITHVLETHIHADHLSRARALVEATGATLHLPRQERVDFPYAPVDEGDVIELGSAEGSVRKPPRRLIEQPVRLRAIRTPGHTDESTCFLVDGAALVTGDTLFVDGVGRPDLEASGEAAVRRAGALYDSLHRILRDVNADAVVLPGHTSRPVSFDGQMVGETLKVIRDRVEALSLSRDDFLERILGRIPPTPPNYERIVRLNEEGATQVDDLMELEAGANRCAVS